jgi:hypothetical protein
VSRKPEIYPRQPVGAGYRNLRWSIRAAAQPPRYSSGMLTSMPTFIQLLRDLFRSRLSMQIEILALRHQLGVCQRTAKRPPIRTADRILWSWLSGHWSRWREVLVFVRPAVSPAGEDGHRMATTEVPGALDQAEQPRETRTAYRSPRGPRSDPPHVINQPSLGCT